MTKTTAMVSSSRRICYKKI